MWEKVPLRRSWKARYSHVLGRRVKIYDFQIFIDSDRKKVKFLYDIILLFNSTFHSCTKVYCSRTKICWSIQFYIVKKFTKILKSHFLKKGFFQIPFLKFYNSVSFWARELGEVSFNSKFFIDYYTGHYSITAKWDLFCHIHKYFMNWDYQCITFGTSLLIFCNK